MAILGVGEKIGEEVVGPNSSKLKGSWGKRGICFPIHLTQRHMSARVHGEPQSFALLADGFRLPRLGETTEVQISAIESAEVSFDQ